MGNKRVVCLGDSITEGVGVNIGERYVDYLCELLNVETFGYGENGAEYIDLLAQAERMFSELGEMVDYVIVFAGTNDFYFNVPIGEWFSVGAKEVLNDLAEQNSLEKRKVRFWNFDTDTFKGRINVLLSFLKKKYADKEIVLLTPIHRAFATFGAQNVQYDELHSNSAGIFFDEYVQAVKEAADVWSVRLVDAYKDSGLFPLVDENAKKYFVSAKTDRLHLNQDGHYRLAKTIAAYFRGTFFDFM